MAVGCLSRQTSDILTVLYVCTQVCGWTGAPVRLVALATCIQLSVISYVCMRLYASLLSVCLFRAFVVFGAAQSLGSSHARKANHRKTVSARQCCCSSAAALPPSHWCRRAKMVQKRKDRRTQNSVTVPANRAHGTRNLGLERISSHFLRNVGTKSAQLHCNI